MTPRPPFTVEVAGPFPAAAVREEWTDVGRRSTPEIEALIEETWAAKLEEARARGGMLWSGPMGRLVDWRIEGGHLTIRFGPTDYRDFVGTNVAHPWIAERFGPAYLSDGCGVSALVRTADGRLVLQRRSDAVFEYAGLIAACGGAVEPIVPDDPSSSLVAQARRELSEELGLDGADITSMSLLGIGRSADRRKPEVVYLAEVSLAWLDLAERAHEEHAGLVALADTPAAVAASLRDEWRSYAPPGLLALTLREVCRFATGLSAAWSAVDGGAETGDEARPR